MKNGEGLTVSEIATILGVSQRTAERIDAKAWSVVRDAAANDPAMERERQAFSALTDLVERRPETSLGYRKEVAAAILESFFRKLNPQGH